LRDNNVGNFFQGISRLICWYSKPISDQFLFLLLTQHGGTVSAATRAHLGLSTPPTVRLTSAATI